MPIESKLCNCVWWGGSRCADQSQHCKAAARGSLPAMAGARAAETVQPQNSIWKTPLAKATSYIGLWASTFLSVCCMGDAEIKMNLKTEGDESSYFPCPPPTPVKAMYRENLSFHMSKKMGR